MPRSNDILKGDTYGSANPRGIHLDPSALLPALAMVTRHLGLAATLDHDLQRSLQPCAPIFPRSTSSARAARAGTWSPHSMRARLRTSASTHHVDHSTRYERAGEFIDVVNGLWDSWEKGAVLRDKERGIYFDVTKVHFLQHKGKFFKVRGPLPMDRCPQVRPVIFQAGASEPGRELAARTADVIFTLQTNISASRAFREDIRARAVRFGRDPDKIKILVGATPFVGKTDQEARDLRERMRDLIPEDIALTLMMNFAGGLDLRKFDLNDRCRICLKPMPGSRISRS